MLLQSVVHIRRRNPLRLDCLVPEPDQERKKRIIFRGEYMGVQAGGLEGAAALSGVCDSHFFGRSQNYGRAILEKNEF